jgi:hypothetical protein
MSTIRDTVIALVEKSKATWDFDTAAAELTAVIEAVQRDGTLAEISKRPLINIGNVALKTLDERRRSPQHLQHALSGIEQGIGALSDEQTDQLAAWFFRIAYSGNQITSEIERIVRPVLARTKKNQNPQDNEKRYRSAFENYRRLAEWGTDLALSQNNLNGLIIASRVAPLRPGVGEDIRAKCEQALVALQARRKMSAADLAKDSLAKCGALIEPTWRRFSRGENCFLEQQDSKALHICLFGLQNTISETEDLAEAAQGMTEEVNSFRSRFEQIRFPSSTTLLARFEKEISNLNQELDRTIDFGRLRLVVTDLKKGIEICLHGKTGVNWMHKDHVAKARRDAEELYDKILQKERDPGQFEAALRLIETDVGKLEPPGTSLTASQLRRLQVRIGRDAPLVTWITICFISQPERTQAWGRIEAIKSRLNQLWVQMESQQEQRAAEFREECVQFNAQIQESVQLRQVLDQLRELQRAVTEFTAQKQRELSSLIDELAKTFRQRAADAPALRQLIQTILEDIDRAHRRIFASIDFDEFNTRASNAKQWLNLGNFSEGEGRQIGREIARCFGEIRKLRFRQEKMNAERQAKADELAAALQQEIAEVNANVAANPGAQDSWRSLVEMDGRLGENWRYLTDAHRQLLRDAIDAGFQKIRAARAAFAAEAAKIFAQYNEILSDTLFALEEEASKEAAFEAIERVKPVRNELKNDRRLLKKQRDELYALLSQISSSIEEIFNKADSQATQEFSRIRTDMENLDDEIKRIANWQSANALFEKLKQLGAQIQSTDLRIVDRKECRAEMDRLFDEVKERLQEFRFSRAQTEDPDAMLARLERQGYLILVRDVPRII